MEQRAPFARRPHAPPGAGCEGSATAIAVHTYAERPELWRTTAEITEGVWPKYNRHGDVLDRRDRGRS